MNRLPFVVLGAAAAALIVCPFYFEHSTRGFLRIETVHAVAFSGQPAPVQPSMTAQQNAWHSLNIFCGTGYRNNQQR